MAVTSRRVEACPAQSEMSTCGYERRFRPVSEHDRSTPESRPSSCKVRFLGVEVRSTSDSRRRWARSAKTGYDPKVQHARAKVASGSAMLVG